MHTALPNTALPRTPGLVLVLGLVLGLGSCATSERHQPASIPFDIDHLTEAQRGVIRELNATDETPYLEKSRPVWFQIVQVRNDADETRDAGPNLEPVDVLVYGQGEAEGDRLVDYGWIERADTGERIWTMTTAQSQHADGDPRNRRVVARLRLEPGRYRLRYISNGSHAYLDWLGEPPERPRYYGIAVFNLTALPRIDAALARAGAPALARSLR